MARSQSAEALLCGKEVHDQRVDLGRALLRQPVTTSLNGLGLDFDGVIAQLLALVRAHAVAAADGENWHGKLCFGERFVALRCLVQSAVVLQARGQASRLGPGLCVHIEHFGGECVFVAGSREDEVLQERALIACEHLLWQRSGQIEEAEMPGERCTFVGEGGLGIKPFVRDRGFHID